MDERKCANCKYYFFTTTRNSLNNRKVLDTSECRRYAPRIDYHRLAGERGIRFPHVYPHDWCGEFELKESESKLTVNFR